MSTDNRVRADSASDSSDGSERDAFDLLRLEQFEKHINVGEAADTTGPEAVEVERKEESQDPAEVSLPAVGKMETDLFGAAGTPGTQADPETELENHDDEDHHDDAVDHKDAEVASPKDEMAELRSDQAPRAPIHATDLVVTGCLEDTVTLGPIMGTHHMAAGGGAGAPVLGEEPCDEKLPEQGREVVAREGAGVPVLSEEVCDERVPEQDKEGDRNLAAMTCNERPSEVEGEGRNSLGGGGREQRPTLNDSNDVNDVIYFRAIKNSKAVLDVAVKGTHAGGDSSKVVLNSHTNIDSGDGLDLEADKHGDGDGDADGDGDGDTQIEGGRRRDGDHPEGDTKIVKERLCGVGVETVSTSQGADQAGQARALHAGNIGVDNDARVREIEYGRRLQILENKMVLVLAMNRGRASRTQQPAPDVNVTTPIGGNSQRRSEHQAPQERPFVQELQRFFVLVVCCTAVTMLLSRRGIISLFPVDSGLHPVHGCQSEPFNPLEKAMVPVSGEGEKPGHEGHEEGKPLPAKKMKHVEFFGEMQRWELVLDVDGLLWMCVVDRDDTETLCQGVAEDISVGAVDLLDKKGDKILNMTIKAPPSRKWWNMFAAFWKEPLGVKVTKGFGSKTRDDGYNSQE